MRGCWCRCVVVGRGGGLGEGAARGLGTLRSATPDFPCVRPVGRATMSGVGRISGVDGRCARGVLGCGFARRRLGGRSAAGVFRASARPAPSRSDMSHPSRTYHLYMTNPVTSSRRPALTPTSPDDPPAPRAADGPDAAQQRHQRARHPEEPPADHARQLLDAATAHLASTRIRTAWLTLAAANKENP